MDLRRFWRHVVMTPWSAARAFPSRTLDAVQAVIAREEKRHRGEVRFVVEAELTSAQLWRGLRPRDRAIELFAALGVWDTDENTGVLVYVLLADRAVEIVADRGISESVAPEEWNAICRVMQEAFRGGRFEEGSVAGVRSISALLAGHFPAREANANELPDRPLLI